MSPTRLILASGSPQRRAILTQLGVGFEVIVSGAEELETGPPEELALENAYRKAAAVVENLTDSDGYSRQSLWGSLPILGVDTVVALGSTPYGKPRDRAHAGEILGRLSGATHRVISGVCLIEPPAAGRGEPRVRTAAASTAVTFRRLDPVLVDWYLGTDEWRDRAGGYAIQARGAALVERIEGDYLNVVGLPVTALLDLLPDLVHG